MIIILLGRGPEQLLPIELGVVEVRERGNRRIDVVPAATPLLHNHNAAVGHVGDRLLQLLRLPSARLAGHLPRARVERTGVTDYQDVAACNRQ